MSCEFLNIFNPVSVYWMCELLNYSLLMCDLFTNKWLYLASILSWYAIPWGLCTRFALCRCQAVIDTVPTHLSECVQGSCCICIPYLWVASRAVDLTIKAEVCTGWKLQVIIVMATLHLTAHAAAKTWLECGKHRKVYWSWSLCATRMYHLL